MKITAYCRVSTDKEEQENSLQNQISYFKREITARGNTYIPLYADEGLTGTKLNNRQEFNRMLYDSGIDVRTTRDYSNKGKTVTYYDVSRRKPKFEEIWVKNTSRFARNTLSYEIIQKLRQKGVYVYFIEQNINTRDLSQEFLLKLFQLFDEQESRDKSSKVSFGFREKARQGRIITNGLLFGYDYRPKPEEKLIINEDEAKIVRKIFELYSQGYGVIRITNILTANNMFTRQGKQFCKTTVNKILNNEKYAGINNVLKYDKGKIFDKRPMKINKEYGDKPTKDIEPIISLELFNKCKAIREGKINYKLNVGVYNGITAYANILWCSRCGQAYNANVDKGRRFYNCKMKKRNGTQYCDGTNISESILDDYLSWLVCGGLSGIIQGSLFYLSLLTKAIVSDKLARFDNADTETAREIQEKLEKEKNTLQNYYQMYARETAQKEILTQLIQEQETKISRLEADLQEAEKDNKQVAYDIDVLCRQLKEAEKRFRDFESQEITVKNVRYFLDKVFVYYLPKDYFDYKQGQNKDDKVLYWVQLYHKTLDEDVLLLTADNITSDLSKAIAEMKAQTNTPIEELIKNDVLNSPEQEKEIYNFNLDSISDFDLKLNLSYIDNMVLKGLHFLESDNYKDLSLTQLLKYCDKIESDKQRLLKLQDG